MSERKSPTKSRAVTEYEEQHRRQELADAAECSVRVHATPLPASTILPLYERMAHKEQARRNLLAKSPPGAHSTVVKPFKMSTREMAKHDKATAKAAKPPTDDHQQFKATPVPRGLLDPNKWSELQIANKLREASRGDRAEWMLEQSTAPGGNLHTRGSPEHRKGAVYHDPNLTFSPAILKGIPDYNEEARKFEQKVAAVARCTRFAISCC
jgi:protein FAM161A